jgi:hypothetical protein
MLGVAVIADLDVGDYGPDAILADFSSAGLRERSVST